jgi:hypothetical protein
VTRLSENAAGEGRAFSPANFATELHALLDSSNLNPANGASYSAAWSLFGPRGDINVARAQYRAWIDEYPPAAMSVSYELLGVRDDNATARLGYITVDLTQPQDILGVSRFRQVLIAEGQCDLPDVAKDDYTVALNWDAPGSLNVSDRIASQLYIGGMDIYRTSSNLDLAITEAPVRDIAAESALAVSDERGNPVLAGLEKVNVPLIVDSGPSTADPKWIEARDKLKSAGMKPGDRRAYYIVPRDFSGNYGPTAGTIVVVPELNRPPAPWNIRNRPDDLVFVRGQRAAGGFSLTWDAVNFTNYSEQYQDGRTFCNVADVARTGVLEYVGKDENCLIDPIRQLRMDVSDYLIYRFATIHEASTFKDSDGDGYSDSDELEAGTQCQADEQLAGKVNYLVSKTGSDWQLANEVLPVSGREVVRFVDRVPAAVPGKVYWYRVASRTPEGRLSFLSAPERGFFPDKTLPAPPEVEVTRKTSGEVPAGCEFVEQTNVYTMWTFEDQVDVSGQTEFGVSCSAVSGGTKYVSFLGSMNPNVIKGRCQSIMKDCRLDTMELVYPPTELNGNQGCRMPVPEKSRFCGQGKMDIVPLFEDGEVDLDLTPGELVPDNITITVSTLEPDSCVSLYQEIEGVAARVASSCGSSSGGTLDYEAPAGFFCGYAVAQDANNNISPATAIPCTLISNNTKAPSPPQVVSIEVSEDQASFDYRLPPEPVAVVVARLTHEAADGTSRWNIDSIPVPGSGAGDVLSYNMPAALLAGSKDRFCVKMLSIGPRVADRQPKVSDYGAERCFLRRGNGEDNPVYLPWPRVEAPEQGKPLDVTLTSGYRSLSPFLTFELGTVSDFLLQCKLIPLTTDFSLFNCNQAGRSKVATLVQPELNVIVYRQSRTPEGVESSWVQVSPFLDKVHWDYFPPDIKEGFQGVVDPFVFRLNDPYFKVMDISSRAVRLVYLDRYPNNMDSGYSYRYQTVYFDRNHKPISWRQSDWVTAP